MERLGFISESASKRNLTFARRFFVMWGALALICFGVSAFLTYVVTGLSTHPANYVVEFGVYGDYGEAERQCHYTCAPEAQVKYSESAAAGAKTSWLFTFPQATTTDVVVPQGFHCYAVPISSTDHFRSPPRLKFHVRTESALGADDWAPAVPLFKSFAGQIQKMGCDGPTLTARTSFARFALPLEFLSYDVLAGWSDRRLPGPRVVGLPATLHVIVDIESADALQILGGRLESPNSMVMQAQNATAEARYVDARLESRRETIFVVIGALIALGAAMVLECLRPFVEFSARRRSRQGQQ